MDEALKKMRDSIEEVLDILRVRENKKNKKEQIIKYSLVAIVLLSWLYIHKETIWQVLVKGL